MWDGGTFNAGDYHNPTSLWNTLKGSHLYRFQSCPTLWRQYEYVSDKTRSLILAERLEKVDCEFGQGGEGYIGEDDWCYNCGSIGHLGDVSYNHALK